MTSLMEIAASRVRVGTRSSSVNVSAITLFILSSNSSSLSASSLRPAACLCPPKDMRISEHLISPSYRSKEGILLAEPWAMPSLIVKTKEGL